MIRIYAFISSLSLSLFDSETDTPNFYGENLVSNQHQHTLTLTRTHTMFSSCVCVHLENIAIITFR